MLKVKNVADDCRELLSIPGLGISNFNAHSLLGFGLGLGLVDNLLPDCEKCRGIGRGSDI